MDDMQNDTTGNAVEPQSPSKTSEREVSEERKQLVSEWIDKIKDAEHYWKPCWDRMKKCRQLAAEGAEKTWIDADSYVVPLAARYVNVMVSMLYAKNPRAYFKRRERLMHTVWDGTPQQIKDLMGSASIGDPMAQQQLVAVLRDIDQAKQYDTMVDRLGKTLVCLWDYFTSEQRANFKQQMKALVRRAKVNGVAYVRLGFQRVLQPDPDVTAEIADTSEKILGIQAGLAEMADDDYDMASKEAERLKLSLQDLQSRSEIVLREGPVFAFPKSSAVIIDPDVVHLKTLAGAGWIAYRYDMSCSKVRQQYGMDLEDGSFTKFYPKDVAGGNQRHRRKPMARVYEVEDKETETVFVVIDGYNDFVVTPHAPDVAIERFFTLFPLVFNEVETDEEDNSYKVPPSDVWQMRHAQAEYNRSRQGLREHRISNRPRWVNASGALETEDKKKFATAPAHAMFDINGLTAGEKLESKIQRVPVVNIDPNVYEVETVYKDVLRSVGAQEANMGGVTSDTSATQSSISEQSRIAGISDSIDELDDLLGDLARSTGELLLTELAKQTVVDIVGPGAVWPDMPPSREEIAKELFLMLEAGSSGRPNAAAELAKIERAVPYLLQLPGVSPEPLAEKYADLLDIDLDELYQAGAPSIQALNAMMARQATGPAPGGPGHDPNAQGAHGASNAPSTQGNEPGPQPAHPAPQTGAAPSQNQAA